MLRKYKNISFDANLLDEIFLQEQKENTLFIFPTSAEKMILKTKFKELSHILKCEFLTMNEFKNFILDFEKPLLREAKRELLFYQSLDSEIKRDFSINNFFQANAFSAKLWKFIDELNEELISDEDILTVLENTNTFNDWQLEYFKRIQKIKKDYLEYIHSKGFTDIWFEKSSEKINFGLLEKFQRIIIVNQFYYTAFEEFIFNQLEKQKEVVIYTQFPEGFTNEQEITASHINNYLSAKINIFNVTDYPAMLSTFAESCKNISTIIDFQIESQPYYSYLNAEYFSKSHAILFSQHPLFNFLEHLETIKQNAKKYSGELYNIQDVLDLLSCNFYFEITDCLDRKDETLFRLQKLINNNFLYVDKDLLKREIFPAEKDFSILWDYFAISHLVDLEAFFQRHIFTFLDSSLQETNILDILYNLLSDFLELKDFGIEEVADENNNLSELFLDYIKTQKLSFKKSNDKKINLLSLQNTRNRKFDKIAVLNLKEGILPAAPKQPFLLSEFQRKQVGLKTYDDIKRRDKYYFYRLLCQSDEANLFVFENIDKNLQKSSFVEELLLLDKDFCIFEDNLSNIGLLFRSLFKPKEYISNKEFKIEIPFETTDLENEYLRISPTGWANLKGNSIYYFFKQILGFWEYKKDIREDFAENFIGTVAHDILSEMWNKYLKRFPKKLPRDFYSTSPSNDYLESAFNSVLGQQNFGFKVPKNHSFKYFNEIFSPILKKGIQQFFLELPNLIDNGNFLAFPEKKAFSKEEYRGKTLQLSETLFINIFGKADLRIETSTGYYIFDYKTGKSSNAPKYFDQLNIYKLFYSLIQDSELNKPVKPFLYFIEYQDIKSLSKRYSIENLLSEMSEKITGLIKNGYSINDKYVLYEDEDITRRDLYLKSK